MKIKRHLLRASLLVVAASIVGISGASAAVTAPTDGDLFIAFRATDSEAQGYSTTYIVNIGTASNFYSPATSSFTVGAGTGAALEGIYGSGWQTRSDISWSVFGYRNTGTINVYASRERDDISIPSEAWDALANQGARTAAKNALSSVISNTTNGYIYQNASIYSALGVLQTNNASAGYNAAVAGPNDFIDQWGNIEGNFSSGATNSVLDLYRFNGTGTTGVVANIGNFSISNTGVVTFTAVPEPTVPLLGALGTLFLLGGRRRRIAQSV